MKRGFSNSREVRSVSYQARAETPATVGNAAIRMTGAGEVSIKRQGMEGMVATSK